MNHLEEAKRLIDDAKYEGTNKQIYWGIEQVDVAQCYALIAIAEQLEKLVGNDGAINVWTKDANFASRYRRTNE